MIAARRAAPSGLGRMTKWPEVRAEPDILCAVERGGLRNSCVVPMYPAVLQRVGELGCAGLDRADEFGAAIGADLAAQAAESARPTA